MIEPLQSLILHSLVGWCWLTESNQLLGVLGQDAGGSILDNCYLQHGDANCTRNSRLVVPKASLASRAGFVLETSLMERIKMALHAS
jgi:hypothetical protein